MNRTVDQLLEERGNVIEYKRAAQKASSEGSAGDVHEGAARAGSEFSIEQFYSFAPTHHYIYAPDGSLWTAAGINGRLPRVKVGKKYIPASEWLDRYKPVEQLTWAPGLPQIIADRLATAGGWIDNRGSAVFNLYHPPQLLKSGDPTKAGPWIDHVHRLYPDYASHIVNWLAHRVQRPGEKINHALVLGGTQGIGKDTLLEPIKRAIGPWNFTEVSPHHLLGRFNGFTKSVILRISEARDLGDRNRFAFYEHMKVFTAAPPDVLRVDEKNIREYSVRNVCGVVITTNHRTDGIFLPPDDRRHFVAWSESKPADFEAGYWRKFYNWLANGGEDHVTAYLAQHDLSGFDPKAPPPKTPAFFAIVEASAVPEDDELADALDKMGRPDAVTLATVQVHAAADLIAYFVDRKNSRAIPHRMEQAGYAATRNPGAEDGRWKIKGRRQVVYAKVTLSQPERIKAVHRLLGERGYYREAE